jgi:hypothetical protein
MPLGQASGFPRADPRGRVNPRFWHRLIRFRHFIEGLLALASLNLACRNLVPAFPQRSPPRLLSAAACGGLRPEPDCRPRRGPLHLSFHRMAAYTRCLRCAGAPRRPTSGSGLRSAPSWHAVLYDPGESDHRQFQSNDVGIAFAESRPARHSQNSRNPFHAADDFRGFLVRSFATACQIARPPVRI